MKPEIFTSIKDALQFGQEQLAHHTSALVDSQALLCFVLNRPKAFLYAHAEDSITKSQLQQYQTLVQRRKIGEPLAYLTGEKEFWSLPLKINESVLIPRPETELLVELALESIEITSCASVLDLGCGSGAIAIAVAHERPNSNVFGVDSSADAVGLSQSNANRLGLSNTDFKQSNWFNDIPEQRFDLILSNPPYIANDDPNVEPEVTAYEPNSALYSKDTGLADLTHIIQTAKSYLKPRGKLIVEHGWQQGSQVRELLQQSGYSQIKTSTDLNDNPRCTQGLNDT